MMREKNKVENDDGVVKFDSKALHDMVIKRLERYISRESGTTKTSSTAAGKDNDTDEIEE